ncbi:YigZ family protein [Pelosinus baikalensis]|uniref:YigZ family protein n=1 Tax=Pelosinus baikalensis TaxID=2892015 RepID=A0ABS8HQU6_9FIRM|nr:YigZ family protein [Pelosinus baikalensis]MCC5465297.1 YigZ family protein [Pelosinus baikalensis]
MLSFYLTVSSYGEAEIEIQKSRFIAYVQRAEQEEAAVAFIEKIKKKHWNATHNCSAYVIGGNDQWQKADDDGEPSGTAGKPILEIIKKNQLKDTVIVVTRYFGGIKLGAGGLIRAYGKSASAGLKAVGITQRQNHTRIGVEIDYTFLGMLENQLRLQGYQIEDKIFTDTIRLIVLEKVGQEEILEQKVIDWTAGQVTLTREGEVYVETLVTCQE